jgi:putative endonuclease
MWYVYIILCQGNSLYTGISTNPQKRFQDHLAGRGARYTKAHPPLKLVHSEEALSRAKALKREHQIKSWPRDKKISEFQLQVT